jgi:type IV pilus assembly protein PilC
MSSVLSAESAQAAADILHARGLVVLSIRRAGRRIGSRLLEGGSFFTKRAKAASVSLVTRQLATMLRAGLPLVRALHALSKDGTDPVLSSSLKLVANEVSAGETFSGALAQHPGTFSTLYVNLVRAGEESGNLDAIMLQLAEYLDRVEDIKRRVKSAMAYPVFLIGFVILTSALIFLKIIPMMAAIYAKLGVDLPVLTQTVVSVSNFLVSQLWVTAAVLICMVIAWKVLMRRKSGRLMLDTMMMRLPVVGGIITKVVMAKFLRTLGVLVESGLPIIESLRLSGGTAGSSVITHATERMVEMISRGSSLSAAFKDPDVFPEIVVQMVGTGEETGSLSEMLTEIAGYYDEQSATAIDTIASIIEPAMIVIVGGMIGFVVVATFMPIFTMGQALRRGSY